MTAFFAEVNIELIDFKLEFGRLSDGTIVLADEISPDTCRFWDSKTHENWIRIVSAATSAMLKAHITRFCTA